MNLTGLLRIAFRWKKAGLLAFFSLLGLGLALAWGMPLLYESEAILERKPIKITPVVSKQDDEEFDVYRLTSESQRNVALLKSHYIMEQWLDAIGLKPDSPRQKEHDIAKLVHSLTVQPVSYTDLLTVKVRAFSPEEARQRAGLLIDRFTQWDLEQNRQQTLQQTQLLQKRLEDVNHVLSTEWARLKSQKADLSLSLSGSSAAKQLEVALNAEGKLYDLLTTELEEAERQLESGQMERTRIIAMPSLPGKPVLSRGLRSVLAFFLSLFGALGFIFFLEWQDPTIRRTQDIVREVPSYPVLAIPILQDDREAQSAPYLGLLADAIGEHVRSKESTVVQFVSASDNEDKTFLCRSLAMLLAGDFHLCLVHQATLLRAQEKSPVPLPPVGGKDIHAIRVSVAEPLSKHLAALKKLFNLFLLNTDSVQDIAPGSNLVQEADLICILVTAGQTSRYYLRALRSHLARFPQDNLLFILDRYTDPLPRWLQAL
jgi:uncharacterized protein involved in exopolysaccharide biosynthesis